MAQLLTDDEIKKGLLGGLTDDPQPLPQNTPDVGPIPPPAASSPADMAQITQAPSPQPMAPNVAEYLQNKYPDQFANLEAQKSAASQKFDTENPAPGPGGKITMGIIAALKGDKSYQDLMKGDLQQRAGERQLAMQPYNEKIQALSDQLGISKQALEFGGEQVRAKLAADASNAGSDYSKNIVGMFSRAFPAFKDQVAGKSADEVQTAAPWAKEWLENQRKQEENRATMEMAHAKMAEAISNKDYAHHWQSNEAVSKSAASYNKAVSGFDDSLQAIDQAAALLGPASKGNQQAINSLGPLLTKAFMGNKRGTADSPFVKNTGIASQALDFLYKKAGDIRPEDVRSIAENIALVRQSNLDAKKQAAARIANQHVSSFGGELPSVYQAISGKPYEAKMNPSQAHSPDILAYAQAHGITPEKAAAIKQQRQGTVAAQ